MHQFEPAQADARKEVELKYSIPDEPTFAALVGLRRLGPFFLRRGVTQHLTDEYVDTSDSAFRKAGYSCRFRRCEEGSVLVTIKSLASRTGGSQAIHDREEMEVEVMEPYYPKRWPKGSARTFALRIAGKKRLHQVVALEQVRQTRQVWSGGRPLVEICLDKVTLEGGKPALQFLEIESLGKEGHREGSFLKLGDAFEKRFPGLRPEPSSKLELALENTGHGKEQSPDEDAGKAARSPGILPDDRMSEAGRKVLLFHFNRMLRHEKGTLKGEDIEELHDMRVATRRMRAAVRVFRSYFEKKALKPFSRALQETGRALGRVRDLDVLLDKLFAYESSLEIQDRSGLEGLRQRWNDQRDLARQEMISWVHSPEFRNFKSESRLFLEAPESGVPAIPGDTPVRTLASHVVASTIWIDYERIRAYEWVLERASLETLHDLRIEIKRLRYLLEFFREVLGPRTADVIRVLTHAQDLLGELHDSDVAVQLLTEYLREDSGLPEGRVRKQPAYRGVVLYLQAHERNVRRLRKRVPVMWRRLNHLRLRRWLGAAVAPL